MNGIFPARIAEAPGNLARCSSTILSRRPLATRRLQHIAGLDGLTPRRLGKIFTRRYINNGAGRVDDEGRAGPSAGFHRGRRIAALSTNTGDEQRQGGSDRAHALDLCRVGSAHHQTQLTIRVSRSLHQTVDMFIEQRLTVHRSEALVLQIIAAGVGGAAQ